MPVSINGSNTPTAGGAVYGDGTAYATTAAGTAGQVLTSAGASAPTWGTLSTGSMVFITSVTASNSATVDVEDAMTTYDMYCIMISGIDPATTGTQLRARLKISGAYVTTSTYFSQNGYSAVTAFNVNVTNTVTYAVLARAGMSGTVESSGNNNLATYYICNPSSTTRVKPQWFTTAGTNILSSQSPFQFASCYNSGTGAVTGVRFFFDTGNISSGTFRLYGIKNS